MIRAGRRRPLPGAALALLATVLVAAGATRAGGGDHPPEGTCRQSTVSAAYTTRVLRALGSGRDVWGEELLATREGPSYDGVRRYLHPLLLAKAPKGQKLTRSGVHYVPLAVPLGAGGAGSVALHVADGSEIVSQRVGGRSLTVTVGEGGRERYGSCLARLATPTLLGGYLPILDTGYVDAARARYRQQSFVARVPQTGSLVSFVRVEADTRESTSVVELRFTPSVGRLSETSGRLVNDAGVHVLFSPGGAFDGTSLRYIVRPDSVRTVYVAWMNDPGSVGELALQGAAYDAARRATTAYWEERLAEGATFDVPEKRIRDAQRSVLIQNLGLTWRYSIGNPYEEFSFPEGIDVAQVMAAYGFDQVAAEILRTSLDRRPTPYPNWKMGEKLLGSAVYVRLFSDRAYLEEVTPVLRGYVDTLGRQITASKRGMLRRERYSSDIPDSVYGLHSQAVVWQGLRAMGQVWATTGRLELAARCRALAARLEAGLRKAVRVSQRRLPDGSLFLPVRLLDHEPAYPALTASRGGSYWNLVMPYALASGLFAPGGTEARGVARYMSLHGSRLLGLVRAGAYALYRDPVYPISGTDQVYGINVARFLADNGRPDQLVLSLYGHAAAGMTPGTFVSGEAASVAPLDGVRYRSMYLPPNGAGNAALLETLRLMLVHETRSREGEPNGLELAHATPRPWLRPGRRIAVRNAPTSFGRVSFSIDARPRAIHAVVDVPNRERPPRLSLRLRLPPGGRMTGVTLDGRPFRRFDAEHETIDLSGRSGRVALVVSVGRR